MILNLNKDEANILTEILDRCVKLSGIEVASACGFFFDKLKLAALEEAKASKPENSEVV